MGRYTGPRVKKLRALGVDLPGLSRKSRRKRAYNPGQHGQGRRRKVSDYGVRLTEKQKIRFNYGMTERQLRRLIEEARRSSDETGNKIAELAERRLDNVIFRAGFGPTIPAARQLVNHSHFRVNGKKVNIASYRVRIGDEITLRDRSQNLDCVEISLENPALTLPAWIELDKDKKIAKVVGIPTIDTVPFPLEIQLVIEYYSRLL